jgi:predicted RNA-binding protein with PUA-like domain
MFPLSSVLIFCVSIRVHPWFNFRMNCWLAKSEPEAYAWSQLVQDGRTAWTGVRNYAARLNLRAMKPGDPVFFYPSGESKSVVGLARVVREAYPDPTATEGDWSCVDLEPVKPLKNPVTLADIKADAELKEMKLVKQSRLSVSPLTRTQFERLLALAGTKA